jgi:hypothetical protein
VAIGDKDFTPNAAAMLDVQAKNKGILIPRMTYTERMYIQTNVQSVGLLVYQTDREAGFYYWDGLAWKYLAPPQSVTLPNFAAVATSGSYDDLTSKPNIPTRLQDLQQDDNYYTTVSRAERERWYAAAHSSTLTGSYNDLTNRPELKAVATSGDYNDLTNKPSFSGDYNDLTSKPELKAVATTGSYNDLTDRPNIPTRLQDMQQDEIYYTTVTRAEREYWSGKANLPDIPTRLQDLEQDENYYTTVTKVERERWNAAAQNSGFSGDYNDLTNKPRLGDLQQDAEYYTTVSRAEREAWSAKSNFSGSYSDLQGRPEIPAHLRDLQADEYYQTVSRNEKETWNSRVSQADLNDFVTPTERANWNQAASNATTAVTKTKLSDFDSNDDSKHYTVEEKTKLAGIAAGAEVNVNADWNATGGDAQLLNKPTLGDLAAKSRIANADIEGDAAISLSKVNIPDNGIPSAKISGLAAVATSGSYNDLEDKPSIPDNIVTYTADQSNNIVFNKNPSLTVSGGGNTGFGNNVADFVVNNAEVRAALINAVIAELTSTNTQTGTALQKAAIGAALPIGTIVMWRKAGNIPCGWTEVEEMRSRFPVGTGQGYGLTHYTLGNTGGEEMHALSVEEMPPHTHNIQNWAHGSGSGEAWVISVDYKEYIWSSSYVQSTGGRNGSVVPHENRPPYYAVTFIEKTSNCVDTNNLYN